MKTLIIRAHFLRQSRKKPGFSLQSFGYANRISASIPLRPTGFKKWFHFGTGSIQNLGAFAA
jgi:hypothetical protein